MMTSNGLNFLLESCLSRPMRLIVFNNPVLPHDGMTPDELQQPSGYKPAVLDRRNWNFDEDDIEATAKEVSYTFPGYRGLVYGWALISVEDARVIHAEPWANPYQINSDKDRIRVAPTISIKEASDA